MIYQSECRDCDAIYVDQTGRKLKNEISRTSQSYMLHALVQLSDRRVSYNDERS